MGRQFKCDPELGISHLKWDGNSNVTLNWEFPTLKWDGNSNVTLNWEFPFFF